MTFYPTLVRPVRLPFRLTCLLLSLAVLPSPLAAQPLPDRDTLLLLQFDHTLTADYAVGTPNVDSQVHATGLAGGRFRGGVDLAAGDQIKLVGDDGNFHPPEGTIEFWVKPHWAGDAPEKQSFFNCRMGEREYININTLGRGRLGIAVAAGEGDQWKWRRADGDTSAWKPDEWHHVAFAWGRGELHVYFDGQESADVVTGAQMPSKKPDALAIVGGDAVIDSFRISKRMFSEEDAKQSIAEAHRPPYHYVVDMPRSPDAAGEPFERRLLGGLSIPLVLRDMQYLKGISCRPGDEITIRLPDGYAVLETEVGIDAFSDPRAVCSFEIRGDGNPLFESGRRSTREPPQKVSVLVSGVKQLTLSTSAEGKAGRRAWSVWGNPVLRRDPKREVLPAVRKLEPATLDMYRRQQAADNYTFEPSTDGPYFTAHKFWEDEIDPAQPPGPELLHSELKAVATPGEYEPINFVIYAVDDLKQVSVELTDLTGSEQSIPAGKIDARLVLRGLMRDLYTLPPERSTVVSRFLLPLEKVDFPAGTFREYHLIVHVPEQAAAGAYRGQVRIRPAGGPAMEVPIEMTVLPFRLREPGKAYGMYYRFPTMDSDWSYIDQELADIRAHGCTTLKPNVGIEYEAVDGKIDPSFERLQRMLVLLKKYGFRGPLPVESGCLQAARLLAYDPVKDYADVAKRERFFAVVKGGLMQMLDLFKEYPEMEPLATHMDEVFGRDRLELYIRLTEAVRQIPSLRVYITLHNTPRPGIPEMMQQADPYVDVRCYNGHALEEWVHAGHTFDDLRHELEEAGDEGWTYHNIRGAFFESEWPRLVNGLWLWGSPLRVHVPWMYYSFSGNPLDATDGPRTRGADFAYAAPDPRDPTRLVSTRHWEAFREGVDDIRYLATLEFLLRERPDSPHAGEAQAWLDRLRRSVAPVPAELQAIEKESPILVWLSQRLNGAEYRRLRREAAEHITRLGR